MAPTVESHFEFETEPDEPAGESETHNPYRSIPWSRRPGAKRAACLLILLIIPIAFSAYLRPTVVRLDNSMPSDIAQELHDLTTQMQVDINQATLADLQVIPGIGPATARKIITERETNGLFASLNDLRRLKGIGPRTVEKIADYVGMTHSDSQLTDASHSSNAKAPDEAEESTHAESTRPNNDGEPN